MARGKLQLLTWALDLRHLWSQRFRWGIAISAALAGIKDSILGCPGW